MDRCLAVNCEKRNCNAQAKECWEYCLWWNTERGRINEYSKEKR